MIKYAFPTLQFSWDLWKCCSVLSQSNTWPSLRLLLPWFAFVLNQWPRLRTISVQQALLKCLHVLHLQLVVNDCVILQKGHVTGAWLIREGYIVTGNQEAKYLNQMIWNVRKFLSVQFKSQAWLLKLERAFPEVSALSVNNRCESSNSKSTEVFLKLKLKHTSVDGGWGQNTWSE